MKYLACLLFSLLLISCSKSNEDSDTKECTPVEYNTTFSMVLDDEVCFPDGSGFIVKTITDEFCPCDAVCFWEGELRVMIETIETDGEKDLISFGSSSYTTNPSILSNSRIETFTFTYNETGKLPDCELEYDASKVILYLNIVEE